MCREIEGMPLASGATGTYIPGEIENAKRGRRLEECIPVAEGVEREFREVAQDLGISFP